MSNSSNKSSFFETVANTVDSIVSSRRAEDMRGIDAVAETILSLGYLTTQDSDHNRIDLEVVEARQAEIDKLEADHNMPAADTIEEMPTMNVEAQSLMSEVPSTMTDEQIERQRYQAEARQAVDDIYGQAA